MVVDTAARDFIAPGFGPAEDEPPAMRVLTALLFVALLGVAPGARGSAVGIPAPALTAATNLDGTALPPRHIHGRVTVINFWATWCPPCRAETPDLVAAYNQLHGRGVDFLGVDTTETGPIVKTFLSAKTVPYPSVLAGPGAYAAYGIAFIPTTIVVDAAGIIRARWVGGVTPAQLAHYVADARAGRSSVFLSPAQARIDALLALPQFDFDGSAAQRGAAVKAASRAVAAADAIVATNETAVDFERTQHAQGTLLVAAGTAVDAHATTRDERTAGLVMLARGSGDLNEWGAAARAYATALHLRPGDAGLVHALALAYYRLHDYPGMIAAARRFTRLRPADGDAWSNLGLAYQRTRHFRDAAPAYERSLALLRSRAAAQPSQDNLATVADTALDAANVDVSLGDAAGTRRSFALANAYSDRLRADGDYAELKRTVAERTQEGLVAVALARAAGNPVVSVMHWTGPDLPGSLASTLKYRLIVAAPPERTVTLDVRGLRKEWVASFCADGLCSPRTVSFSSPASGVKTYEFQLVPPHDGDRPGPILISVDGRSTVAVPQ